MGSCWGLEKWKTSSLPTRNSQLIVFCKMIGIILLPYLWKMFIMYITFINPLVYPGGKKFPLSTNNVFWAAKKFDLYSYILNWENWSQYRIWSQNINNTLKNAIEYNKSIVLSINSLHILIYMHQKHQLSPLQK